MFLWITLGSSDYDSDEDKSYSAKTKESTVSFSPLFNDNSYNNTSPENELFNINHEKPSTSQNSVYYGSGSKKQKTKHISTSNLFKNIDYTPVQPIITPSSANNSVDESDQGIFLYTY